MDFVNEFIINITKSAKLMDEDVLFVAFISAKQLVDRDRTKEDIEYIKTLGEILKVDKDTTEKLLETLYTIYKLEWMDRKKN